MGRVGKEGEEGVTCAVTMDSSLTVRAAHVYPSPMKEERHEHERMLLATLQVALEEQGLDTEQFAGSEEGLGKVEDAREVLQERTTGR